MIKQKETNPPPKALQILPSLQEGGVEKGVLDLIPFLCPNPGEDLTYVASAGGRLVAPLKALGAQHFSLPLDTKNPLKLIANAGRLAQLAHLHQIQVFHARSRAPAWSALWAARWRKIPLVTTYHGVYNAYSTMKRFYNSVMARGDRVIAISQFMARHIAQQHPHLAKNAVLIPEGIDTKKFNPTAVSDKEVAALKSQWGLPAKHSLILLPARMTRWKGHREFILALSKLAGLGVQNFSAVILGAAHGRPGYRQELTQLIQETQQQNTIRFIDACDQMPAAYALSDVMVSASNKAEAFGRVSAEAAAMGCTLVGTDLGATPELCVPNKTGFLVQPDDPESLARGLLLALTQTEDHKKRLQQAAIRHIQEGFSLKNMAKKTLELYREVLISKN